MLRAAVARARRLAVERAGAPRVALLRRPRLVVLAHDALRPVVAQHGRELVEPQRVLGRAADPQAPRLEEHGHLVEPVRVRQVPVEVVVLQDALETGVLAHQGRRIPLDRHDLQVVLTHRRRLEAPELLLELRVHLHDGRPPLLVPLLLEALHGVPPSPRAS